MTRSSSPWFVAATVALAAACLGGGIWLGRQQAARGQGDGRRAELERQLQTLQQQQENGSSDPASQQRLLELLVALDRKAEATALLESMADRDPQRWQLRLLLAELRRDQGDRSGAAREVRQLLHVRPDQIEALQLLSLLLLEQGRSPQAVQQVQAVFNRQSQPRPQPAALATGLLLAELLQRQGTPGQAEAVLVRLGSAFPSDQRPLLARALMLQERGQVRQAQALLNQARALKPGTADQTLDQVASAWGLAALRGSSPSRQPPTPPGPTGTRNP